MVGQGDKKQTWFCRKVKIALKTLFLPLKQQDIISWDLWWDKYITFNSYELN